jgi:hypothetical protein
VVAFSVLIILKICVDKQERQYNGQEKNNDLQTSAYKAIEQHEAH